MGDSRANRGTILVVDDSELVRKYHGAILREAGYQVRTASDGGEALELLHGDWCDLVLADLNMACVDGFEMTRRLRADPALRGLPVIIVTTEGGVRDRDAARTAGVDDFVTKPCEPDVMLQAVSRMLGRHRVEREGGVHALEAE